MGVHPAPLSFRHRQWACLYVNAYVSTPAMSRGWNDMYVWCGVMYSWFSGSALVLIIWQHSWSELSPVGIFLGVDFPTVLQENGLFFVLFFYWSIRLPSCDLTLLFSLVFVFQAWNYFTVFILLHIYTVHRDG